MASGVGSTRELRGAVDRGGRTFLQRKGVVARSRKGRGRVKGSGLLGVSQKQEGWRLGPVEDLLLQVWSAQVKPEEDTPALVPGWRGQPAGRLWQVAGGRWEGQREHEHLECGSSLFNLRTSHIFSGDVTLEPEGVASEPWPPTD